MEDELKKEKDIMEVVMLVIIAITSLLAFVFRKQLKEHFTKKEVVKEEPVKEIPVEEPVEVIPEPIEEEEEIEEETPETPIKFIPKDSDEFIAPTLYLIEATEDSITVGWNEVDCDHYKLFMRYNKGWDQEIVFNKGQERRYTWENRDKETMYNFLIQAVKGNQKKNSLYGDYGTVRPPIVLPTGLTESVVVNIDLIEGDDNTEYLQNQIDAIPHGTPEFRTQVYMKKGEYNVEGRTFAQQREATLFFRKHYIDVYMGECTLYTNAPAYGFIGSAGHPDTLSHRRQLSFYQCKGTKVYRPGVRGSNYTEGRLLGTAPEHTPPFWMSDKPDPSAVPGFPGYVKHWEREHGIELRDCEDTILYYPRVHAVWGDGIIIGGGLCKGVEVHYPELSFLGRQGICLYDNSDNIKIIKPIIIGARRSAIDMETDYQDGYIRNVEISGGNIECHLTPFAAGGAGDVSDINIHHVKFKGSSHSVYCVSNGDRVKRKNWKFNDNERIGAYGGSDPDIEFRNTDNIEILRNKTAVTHEKGFAAGFSYCDGVTYRDNEVAGGKQIRTYHVTGLDFGGNTPELTEHSNDYLDDL